MRTVADVLVVLVALLHGYFLVLEMFLWTGPTGRRAFAMSKEKAEETKVLAANQGLYNGFLAAGLLWSFVAADPFGVRLFFLGCVLVAGLYGAATASKKILFIQAVPAALGIAAVFLAHR